MNAPGDDVVGCDGVRVAPVPARTAQERAAAPVVRVSVPAVRLRAGRAGAGRIDPGEGEAGDVEELTEPAEMEVVDGPVAGPVHEALRHGAMGEPLSVHVVGTVGEVRQDLFGILAATGVQHLMPQRTAPGGQGAGGGHRQERGSEGLHGAVLMRRHTQWIEAQIQADPGGDGGLGKALKDRVEGKTQEKIALGLVNHDLVRAPVGVELLGRHEQAMRLLWMTAPLYCVLDELPHVGRGLAGCAHRAEQLWQAGELAERRRRPGQGLIRRGGQMIERPQHLDRTDAGRGVVQELEFGRVSETVGAQAAHAGQRVLALWRSVERDQPTPVDQMVEGGVGRTVDLDGLAFGFESAGSGHGDLLKMRAGQLALPGWREDCGGMPTELSRRVCGWEVRIFMWSCFLVLEGRALQHSRVVALVVSGTILTACTA